MTDDQFSDRLRRLLTTQAEQLTRDAPGLAGPLLRAEAGRTGRRAQRFVTPVLAAAAVLALFLLPVLLSRHDGPGPRVTPAGPGSSAPAPSPRPTLRHSVTPSSPTLAVPSPTPSVQTPSATSIPLVSPQISSVPAPSHTD